jgi:hypothetical protein
MNSPIWERGGGQAGEGAVLPHRVTLFEQGQSGARGAEGATGEGEGEGGADTFMRFIFYYPPFVASNYFF